MLNQWKLAILSPLMGDGYLDSEFVLYVLTSSDRAIKSRHNGEGQISIRFVKA
jgi:hypothetical protein